MKKAALSWGEEDNVPQKNITTDTKSFKENPSNEYNIQINDKKYVEECLRNNFIIQR